MSFLTILTFWDYIFSLIDSYGIYFIFLAIFLEYACFPIPSEVILPMAGAICYRANFNLLLFITISSICGLLGSLLCYLLGYFGALPFSKKQDKEKKESTSLYEKYGNISILFSRLIPLVRTYISFICGIKKHKLISFIIYTIIGIIIWNTLLISLGYIFYDNIEIVSKLYQEYKYIILIILFILIIFLFIKKRKTNNNKKINSSHKI